MLRTSPLASLALLLSLSLAACGDDAGTEVGDGGTGTGTGDTGTSDEVGESSSTTSASTSTTTTDETTTTTTDTGSCPVGAEGCPCTGGGGCDPGLACEGGICTMPAGTDTTTDTGTTDPTTTTDTTTTDTGMMDVPYQECPNGDADCAPGEICTMGAANMGQTPWTLCTSGECNGDADCAVNDADVCLNLPGDGMMVDFCVPSACDDQNPCPDANQICVIGFGGTGVCLWPN